MADKAAEAKKHTVCVDAEEPILSISSESTRSGISVASGYTKRLAGFRRHVAPIIDEPALIEGIAEQVRRSTISLRVVTLGLEDPTASMLGGGLLKSRKSLGDM